MSTAMLLVYPTSARAQELYNFDHSHEHAKLISHMTPPLRYTSPNYLLNPPRGQQFQAGHWQMVHQQAHDDSANYYNVHPSLIFAGNPRPESGPTAFTQFINHSEHVALNEAAHVQSG